MTKTPDQPTETPNQIDQLLSQLIFGTELYFESGFCGDWNFMTDHTLGAGIHVVTSGSVWMALPHELDKQTQLHQGDALFFSQSSKHWLSKMPLDIDTEEVDYEKYCVPEHLQEGLVCYNVDIQPGLTEHLFSLMPEYIHIPASHQSCHLQQLITLIQQEANTRHSGYKIAISRLSDVLVLQILREVLQEQHAEHGILAALQNKQIRNVLLAIMDEPADLWSVEQMAEKAFLSKSAFAERCQNVTGLTPKHLLDKVRLQRAQYFLKHTDLSLELIAARIGYQSGTSFIRFFKQRIGLSPGEYRSD